MKNVKILLIVLLCFSCGEKSTTEPINNNPEIKFLTAIPSQIGKSESSSLRCVAEDMDNDDLVYSWEAPSGLINGSGDSVAWIAPDETGIFWIVCKVSDNNGGLDSDSVSVEVINIIPTEGLIAYWPFNGNANDESGNEHHGTVQGATLIGDRFGIENKAYHFDGNDFISVLDDPVFTLGNEPFSLSFWISLDQIGSYYMMGHDEGGGYTRKWIFWFTGNQLGLHERLDGDYWVILTDWTPDLNKWYYLDLIRDGDTFSIYIDGELLDSNEDTRTLPDPNTTFKIGNAEGTDRMFRGKIDDVRFYDIALTNDDIQKLYLEGGWGD